MALHPDVGSTIENDTTPVKVTGEAPTKILWRGRQWAVTTYGIEALDGTYAINAKRLEEDFQEWSWINQVGDKTWVDVADFTTAFMVAIVLHNRAPAFSAEQILADFRRVTRARARD